MNLRNFCNEVPEGSSGQAKNKRAARPEGIAGKRCNNAKTYTNTFFFNSCGFPSHISLFLDFFVGFYPQILEISFFYGITGRS